MPEERQEQKISRRCAGGEEQDRKMDRKEKLEDAGILEHPGLAAHDDPVRLVPFCDGGLGPLLPGDGDQKGGRRHLPEFLLRVSDVRLCVGALHVPYRESDVRHFLWSGGDDPGLAADPPLVPEGQRLPHGNRGHGKRICHHASAADREADGGSLRTDGFLPDGCGADRRDLHPDGAADPE